MPKLRAVITVTYKRRGDVSIRLERIDERRNRLWQRAPVFAYRFEGERFDTGDRGEYVRAVVAAALERPELRDDLVSWLRVRISDKRKAT